MMEKAIAQFATQFSFAPEVENGDTLGSLEKFLVVGMGGSHLSAGLLQRIRPELDIIVHKNYGLPETHDADPQERLIIASSYSGNTEEVLSAYDMARERGLPLAAVATGGKLLEKAVADGTPHVVLPDTGIQPRSALGFSFRGLLKLMRQAELLEESAQLQETLDPSGLEEEGKALAKRLKDTVPVVYASTQNEPIAYNWKIKFNETGKIPAFYNVFPELNHNEMTGFDVAETSRHLSKRFAFIVLHDDDDHPRVQKRMEVLKKLFTDRGFPVETHPLAGTSVMEKIFSSLLLADWAAYYTADQYGLEAEQVPMVEEFKQRV